MTYNSEKSARYGLNKRARSGNFQFHRLPPKGGSLSYLPILLDIIYGVLSPLPFKEAARTSMVSRRWRMLWRCYPKLILTRDTMLHGTITDDHSSTHIVATFIRRVNSVLCQLKSGTLKKFVVIFPLLRRDARHIDRWVSLSATSRARRIILDLCPETENSMDKNDMYCFPLHLFPSDNCVESLCLGFVSLTLPPSLSVFTNLKKLGLHMVPIRGDLQCLLPKCDVLEWLSLTQCSLQDLSICQPLHRLRYLRVQHYRLLKLHVQAPNLTEFELTDYPIPIVVGECLNLSKETIMLLSSSDCFDYIFAELPSTQGFAAGGARFNNLKHLILSLDVQGSNDTNNGIICLASLLQLAPILEELELNIIHACTQLELALYILRSANALAHLIIDPTVKVALVPRLNRSQQRFIDIGRMMAKVWVFKGEYRRIVTIL
ncbi:hypothetical protein BS78_05G159600 [Paspalum vaginatum]|nr:hypothetical protein BS78_05G159600 [Paspalum vaginatum]